MKHTRAVLVAISIVLATSFGMAQFEMELVVRDDVVSGKSVVARIPMVDSQATMGNPYAFDKVLLTFRCNNDGLDVYLQSSDWKTFAGYPATIVYRFSNGAPSATHNWGASTTGFGVFLPSSHRSAFAANAMTAETLAIRWTVGGVADLTFIYGLQDFQIRAVPELDACLR